MGRLEPVRVLTLRSHALFYTSSFFPSLDLVSIVGKEFTSHGVILSLSSLFSSLGLSFFWTSFHSLSSLTLGICPVEGFYLPDPSELTFANTLLLSNAAVSLGGAFVSLEISLQFLIFFSLFSFIL